MCVWQPPLFYNWDLDQRPFFNRITGLMRMMMMLGGLISFNLNPMSIFSYPLELGLKAGFINPRYGVDDIIAKVRWMCSTNEQVPVLLLPVPAISGPTIGTTFWLEIEEWARQIRRWIVGSSESFHYFVIHWRGKPLFSGIWWFMMFFMYYAVLLCSAGLFTVLAGIPLPWVTYQTIDLGGFNFSLKNIGLLALVLQYIAFGVAFIIDRFAIRMMTIHEDISIFRNILHWLSAPFVLLVYSLIAFWAIIKFVFVGKGMAKHDMAAKDGLAANTVATNANTTTTTNTVTNPVNNESPSSPISENGDSTHNEKALGTITDIPRFSQTHHHSHSHHHNHQSNNNNTSTNLNGDVEYDDDILPSSYNSRSRSTSISLSQDVNRTSLHRIGGSFSKNALPMISKESVSSLPNGKHPTDNQPNVEIIPQNLLCEMPERFRFGEYTMETSTARIVNQKFLV